MRRSTPGSIAVREAQTRLLGALDRVDLELVIAALEPLVTEGRRERLLRVLGDRLDAVTVLFDAPHDPHNGAAVLRSCEAFGVQRLHVVERIESFLAARTVSRGAERWVDVETYPDVAAAVSALRAAGYELVAAEVGGELVPDDLAHIPRLALVLGNERDGIAAALRAACARAVQIPMRGFIESLNVSVTAAVLLHAAVRGRPGDLSVDERRRLYARALVLTVPHASEVLEARGLVRA